MESLSLSDVTVTGRDKSPPLDLSHHYSQTTKHRTASEIKQVYKLFQIPHIGNLAGGLPNPRFFPFDTLEAQTSKPERWTPSPNHPSEPAGPETTPHPEAPAHIAVPKASGEVDPMKRIDLASALQYGMSQGYPPLLSWVRQFTRQHVHPDVPYLGGPEVSMTCGATDGFAKAIELFVDPWSPDVDDVCDRPGLLCETFVYSNVLSATVPKGMQTVPVKADAGGMLVSGPGGLEDVLGNWDVAKGKRPHVMYTVTLGHNPTGIVLSMERKQAIYAACSKYDVIIIEDEPYWYLQFPSSATNEAQSRSSSPTPTAPSAPLPTSSGYPFLDSLTPSFLALDTDGRVVRLDTFSKTIAPGCRLGWITAQPSLIERYNRIAEVSTQQPSGFVQSLVAELVIGAQPEAKAAFALRRTSAEKARFSGWQMDGWVRWLAGLRGMYERRMSRMCRILDAGADEIKAGVFAPTSSAVNSDDAEWGIVHKTRLYAFSWPRGGMFVWLRIYFERHPLWQAVGSDGETVLGGKSLSTALLMHLTRKPYLVLVGTGSMFSATDEIREEMGWAYYRLCFAAESEENVDSCSQRFVDGVHTFWRIKNVKEIEKLLARFKGILDTKEVDDAGNEVGQLGTWLGC